MRIDIDDKKFIDNIVQCIKNKKDIINNLKVSDDIVAVELINTALKKASESTYEHSQYLSELTNNINSNNDEEYFKSMEEKAILKVSSCYEATTSLLSIALEYSNKRVKRVSPQPIETKK
jgi:hypothetical protein